MVEFFCSKVFGLAFSSLATIQFAKALGASQFGQISSAIAICNLFAVITVFGARRRLVREYAGTETHGGRALTYSMIISLTLFIFTACGYYIYAQFETSDVVVFSFILLLAFTMTVQGILEGASLGLGNSTRVSMANGWSRGLILVIFSLIVLNVTDEIRLNLTFLAYVVAATCSAGLMTYKVRPVFRKSNLVNEVSRAFRSSLPFVISSGAIVVQSNTDIIMLSKMYSDTAAGEYALVSRISSVVLFSVAAASAVYGSYLAGAFKKDDFVSFRKYVYKSWALSAGLGCLASVVVYTGLSTIKLYIGNSYDVSDMLVILAISGSLVSCLFGPIGLVYSMTDKVKQMSAVFIAGAIINVVMNYFTIPSYGEIGAAFTTVVSVGFINITLAIFHSRLLPSRWGPFARMPVIPER